MKAIHPSVLASALTLAALPTDAVAQRYLHLPATQQPNVVDLNTFSILPWSQSNSRAQFFYGPAEVGASSFTATGLSFRFDGPIPAVGAPGPFTIQRVRLNVGVTSVTQPGARFDGNLSQPLTTVFDGPVTYRPDPGSNFPEPWGGQNDDLTFAFNQPLSVTIPSGGRLVVEILLEGNSLMGQAHAMFDAFGTTGGIVDGTIAPLGGGCPLSPGGATPALAVVGTVAPGAAHALTGTDLGANAPVFGVVGFDNAMSTLGPLPYTLPNSTCTFYSSFDLYWLMFADAAGTIAGTDPAAWLNVPADPSLTGLTLYEQLVAITPGANQPYGFAVSDAVTVALGSYTAPFDDVYMAAHSTSATFPYADEIEAKAIAVRFEIQ